jgi:hypothetical protein
VNAPQSKRFARFNDVQQSRQRLECGGFSTAFPRLAKLGFKKSGGDKNSVPHGAGRRTVAGDYILSAQLLPDEGGAKDSFAFWSVMRSRSM